MSNHLIRIEAKIAVNCEWGKWEAGSCSSSCGPGLRTKTRTKNVLESNGGVCIGKPSVSEHCFLMSCPGQFINLFIINNSIE